LLLAGDAPEVVKATGLFKVPKLRGEGDFRVDVPPRCPEGVGKPHFIKRYGPKSGIETL
jgi:hypothetical protein